MAGDFFAPLGTVGLMIGSCVGFGAIILAIFRLLGRMERFEAIVWSFVIGFGVLGWAIFFLGIAGMIGPTVLLTGLVLGLPGGILLRRSSSSQSASDRWDAGLILLLAATTFLVAFDLAEAFSPPADADSLAYHFALPKQFLAAGEIFFVPRAVDGAVPLLVQMTWMTALGLGGETGMTLWATVTSWWLGLLTFVAARPYMSRNWATCVALIVCSAPVMLYSGGTGQVEGRLALFATAGALAMARGVSSRDLNFIGLAGLLAGLCVASKYTGLVLAVATIVPLLVWWRSPKPIFFYVALAALAGLQWYGWNMWHTGDPVFPMFRSLLGFPDDLFWTNEQDAVFRHIYYAAERPLPRTIYWLIAYPFWATLAPSAAIESGRTGLGLYGFVVMPFAIAGAWHWRRHITRHPLSILALIAFAFYILWFASGVSQRVRHLLPIWPIVVVCLTAAAVRWCQHSSVMRPLAAAAILTILIQLGGQAIFGISHMRHILTGESRDDFLRRTVAFYDYVEPTQAEMGPFDRVLVSARQLIYLFDRPVFYFHPLDQSQIVTRNVERDTGRFLHELRAQNITLLLVISPVGAPGNPGELAIGTDALVKNGCAVPIKSFSGAAIGSRTLGNATGQVPATLYRLTTLGCRYS